MRPLATILTFALIATGCVAPTAVSPTASSPPSAIASPAATAASDLVEIGAGLQGPAGLAATVYTAGIPNVAALALDDEGHLWAATRAIEDAGTDTNSVVNAAGAAPRVVVRGLHTVLGLVWVGDDLYVASKKQVSVYRSFDGTAFASSQVIVTFPAGVGEVNGIAFGPDDRLYVGISAPCNACVTTFADSAVVVSFAPDGSDLRIVASGIRAPVGLAFFPNTDELFVTMNQRDDLGDETPGDLLAIVSAGQDWGFPDCYGQVDPACGDVPGPVAVLDTHAAASGVAIVTGELGPTVGTSAVVAEWAKGAVLRVGLASAASATGSGAVVTGTSVPFLTGFQSPVPVISDGTGALFIGDWAAGTVVRVAAEGLPPG
jgi:glucose/arabinose dehydrogenase